MYKINVLNGSESSETVILYLFKNYLKSLQKYKIWSPNIF